MSNVVYFVHCIDTEGPLAEKPLGLGLPSYHFDDDAGSDFDLGLVDKILHHRSSVYGQWSDIFSMLQRATSPEFRQRMPDSDGNGWIYNWFCMDHIGFIDNPRQRAMGVHNIYDVYKKIIDEQAAGDAIHWHFHPMSMYREAHRCATSYLNSPELLEIISRRLIDRRYFPAANRSGFQDQRPDSHWFLEQWIPFDFSNLASDDMDPVSNADLANGRFNDWRWAPDDWSTYHPHHDCYQKQGTCRRKIARCLNLLSRFGNLNEIELQKAFRRADEGKPTLVAFASHDWRDLRTEVNYVRYLLARVLPHFPNVTFKFCEATEAFNAVHVAETVAPIKLDVRLQFDGQGLPKRVQIRPIAGKVFGPQPYLAIRTRSRRYVHDNLNFIDSLDSYYYAFDEHSIMPDDVGAIGIATNDAKGNQAIHILELDAANLKPNECMSF